MLQTSLNYALIALEVLIIFNLLIGVHELGHFLAAKWRGLVIEKFGIWFGPPIWKKKIGGVEYSLGCIPMGGFVSLPQMAPMPEALEGKTEHESAALPNASALDKIIVAFAGPLFSLGLAFVFAGIVWIAGKPTSESENTTVIGYVEKGSPAEAAGLQPGDKILAVDGHPVTRFAGMVNSVAWRVVRSEDDKIDFEIERAGKIEHIDSGWTKEAQKSRFSRASLRQVRIQPMMTPLIAEVAENTPASKAGLKPGDIITAINGQRIYSPIALVDELKTNPDKPVALTIQRGAKSQDFSITPVLMEAGEGEKRPRIGIVWDPGPIEFAHPSPLQQVADSVTTVFNTFDALFSRKSDVKAQHLGGPVKILETYTRIFDSEQGWRLALWFSVVLNVNLALMNMLPIPVLDGGHIMLALIEAVRRKPANIRVLEFIQTACAMLIIGYILYVSFFDVQDLPWGMGTRTGVEPAATATPAK